MIMFLLYRMPKWRMHNTYNSDTIIDGIENDRLVDISNILLSFMPLPVSGGEEDGPQ